MDKISGYSFLYKKSSSVNIEGLEASMKPLLLSLDEVGKEVLEEDKSFGGFVITSAKDSHGDKSWSYHNHGLAIDISLLDSNRKPIFKWTSVDWTTFKKVIAKVNQPNPNFWYLLEGKTDEEIQELLKGTSDINFSATGAELHFHIEYNPARAKQLLKFNVPDKKVDNVSTKNVEKPLLFIYQGQDYVLLKDLVETNPLFKNYLDKSGKADTSKINDLLNYMGGSTSSNFCRIMEPLYDAKGEYYLLFKDYSLQVLNKEQFNKKFPTKLDLPICNSATILLPPEIAQRDFIGLQSENQVFYFDDFPAFISKKRREIETSEDYLPTIKLYGKNGEYELSNQVNQVNSNFSVWIYCKKLGQIIDISKYCKSVMENSDRFSVTLTYVDLLALVKTESTYGSQYEVVLSSGFRDGTSRDRGIQVSSSYGFTKPSLFHGVISQGDIIFIRYETLNLEKNVDTSKCEINEYGLPIVTKDMLPGKCYDLIGFIDMNSQSEGISTDTFSVTVSGSSLSGIFEKDVSLFLPIALIANNTQGNLVFGSSSSDKGLLNRLFVDGSYGYLWNYQARTIEDTVKFYLNQLTSSAIITDEEDLFSSYPESSKTKIFELMPKSDSENEYLKSENASGIYQIIKVDIDKSLKDRVIADSTVSNPQGSISSLFQKLCRPPLVEFFTDTYGDTFHIVIRKPPFDQKSILEYLDYMNEIDLQTKRGVSVPKFVEINADEVDTEDLSWNTDFYTWFQMDSCAIVTDTQSLYTFLPIIYLQEYVHRWGSRPLQYSNPYLKQSEEGTSLFNDKDKAQIVSDMIYILESNIYLPFTRRGTIVLSKGDRRIKKGTWIKYSKTNELYYVDSVVQKSDITNSSVNRTTVLNVSRGMVTTFLKDVTGIEGINEPISYFRLIDLESYKKQLRDYADGKTNDLQVKKNLSVNKTVFDFFLKGRQMIGNSTKVGQVTVGPLKTEKI